MATQVDCQIEERVARVTFRGERGIQILSRETRDRFRDSLDRLEAESDLIAVVFAAEGRTFIAGADIKELAELDPQTAYEVAREGQTLMGRVAALPAVTMIAIHAACAGGGCELALACDLRIGSESARIGLPECGIGIIPGWGGTVRSSHLLGEGAARRMIFEAELFLAPEALKLGLLHEVVADAELSARIGQWLDKLRRRGPMALRGAKRLLRRFAGEPREAQFKAEAATFAACFHRGEANEGLRAFLEKRTPVWPSEVGTR